MGRFLWAGVVLNGVVMLTMRPVLAQNAASGPVLPRDIDRSIIRPGARSLGLGGTILFGRGIPSAAYNPATIGGGRGLNSGLDLVGRSDNIEATDVTDIIHSVRDLNDSVDGEEDFDQDAFDDLFDIARGKNNRPLRATATPSLGFALSNLAQKRFSAGILAFGEAIADVRVNAQGTSGNRTLDTRGGLLGLSTVAVPLSFRPGQGSEDYGTFGINLKLMRADYLAAAFIASEANQDVNGQTFDRADSTKFGLDLGYISPNLVRNSSFDVQAAVALRNLLSPKFDLQTVGDEGNGNLTPLNASFKQQPQLDLGLRAGSARYRAAAFLEVHNLTKKNGGDTTFHIGAEVAPLKMLALRAGYDDNKLTAGLGLALSGVRLDVAISQKIEERLAVGFSFAR